MDKDTNKIAVRTATSWKKRAAEDRKNRRNITRSQQFALELINYMDLHGIKQVELAEKMGVSAQQVNKILRAKSNLTFETLDKIEDALGVKISTPKISSLGTNISKVEMTSMQIVHKRKFKTIEEDTTSDIIVSKNPILETNSESMQPYNYTASQT